LLERAASLEGGINGTQLDPGHPSPIVQTGLGKGEGAQGAHLGEEAHCEEAVFGTVSEGVNAVGRGGVVRVRGACRVGERLAFWGLGDNLEVDCNDDEMHVPGG
jgi:hypothetical protein